MDATSPVRFDLRGPVLPASETFELVPRAGGGLAACSLALARRLVKAMGEGLWWASVELHDDHPNKAFAHLGPDVDGRLYTEVAGDFYLPADQALSSEQWKALRARGWADPIPVDTLGEDEAQPRNHTRSWAVERLPEACAHVFETLVGVYGFTDDDVLVVALDPIAWHHDDEELATAGAASG